MKQLHLRSMAQRWGPMCLVVLLGLAIMTLPGNAKAAFYPEANGAWTSAAGDSDLNDFLTAYYGGTKTSVSSLSGNFQATGLGYESSFYDSFYVTDLGTLFDNQTNPPNGLWSTSFHVDDAAFLVDEEPDGTIDRTYPLNSFNGYIQAYSLDSAWTYDGSSGDNLNIQFQQGDYVVGLGNGSGDLDYDDLIIGLRSASTPVPEPASMLLLGSGLLGLMGLGRKRMLNRRI